MNRRHFLHTLGMAAVAGTLPKQAFAAPGRKPNIIVMLADDLGFSDLGCYGSEIETPKLDALAAGGLRFTQFYNNARCCPSRASLITGQYSHAVGIGAMTSKDNGVPGYLGNLSETCASIPEALKAGGYATFMTGKWHLSENDNPRPGGKPSARGFDRSLAVLGAHCFYFPESKAAKLCLDGENIEPTDARLPKNWYSTDLYADTGMGFADKAMAEGKPFFWYLAFNAPHFPLQAPELDIQKYRGKYRAGWDALREARLKKQVALGLLPAETPLSPRLDGVRAWSDLSDAEKDRSDRVMACYAAAVDHLDQAVGRVVAWLKARGVFENTLILFASDNGGCGERGLEGQLSGQKAGSVQSGVYCGKSWATLENTPFRRWKQFDHEGGIASPLIAHWPAGIGARGELRRQVAHLIDFLPTCLAAAGAAYPSERNGKPVLPMEGISLFPAFQDQVPVQRTLFWEHFGNAGMRRGDWKLVRLGEKGPWELYDFSLNRNEETDVAARYPDLVAEMSAAWNAWAKRVHVYPKPGRQAEDEEGNRGDEAEAPKRKRK